MISLLPGDSSRAPIRLCVVKPCRPGLTPCAPPSACEAGTAASAVRGASQPEALPSTPGGAAAADARTCEGAAAVMLSGAAGARVPSEHATLACGRDAETLLPSGCSGVRSFPSCHLPSCRSEQALCACGTDAESGLPSGSSCAGTSACCHAPNCRSWLPAAGWSSMHDADEARYSGVPKGPMLSTVAVSAAACAVIPELRPAGVV